MIKVWIYTNHKALKYYKEIILKIYEPKWYDFVLIPQKEAQIDRNCVASYSNNQNDYLDTISLNDNLLILPTKSITYWIINT